MSALVLCTLHTLPNTLLASVNNSIITCIFDGNNFSDNVVDHDGRVINVYDNSTTVLQYLGIRASKFGGVLYG